MNWDNFNMEQIRFTTSYHSVLIPWYLPLSYAGFFLQYCAVAPYLWAPLSVASYNNQLSYSLLGFSITIKLQ